MYYSTFLNCSQRRYYINLILGRQMGNAETASPELLAFYEYTQHPVLGEVKAYYVKGEASQFVMEVPMQVSNHDMGTWQQISDLNCKQLLTLHGFSHKQIQEKYKNAKPDLQQPTSKLGAGLQQQKNGFQTVYWQLLNWNIGSWVKQALQDKTKIREEVLWELLQKVLKACQSLQKLGLYPELRNDNIYFTGGRQAKLYWADLLPNNMHRGYMKFCKQGKFHQGRYAPEQLLQMSRKSQVNLNLEKCVVFSLGLVALEMASLGNVQSIYNYTKMNLSEVRKRELLHQLEGKYSEEFQMVMKKLLQFFPEDRHDYKQLEYELDVHYGRKKPVAKSVDANPESESGFEVSSKEADTQNFQMTAARLKQKALWNAGSSEQRTRSKSKGKNMFLACFGVKPAEKSRSLTTQ